MKHILVFFLFLFYSHSISAQFTIVGQHYEYKDNLGESVMKAVYLFKTVSGASFSFDSSASSVEIFRYRQSMSDQELIPASDIQSSTSGGVTTYTVSNLMDSRGYLVYQDDMATALWVIDYSQHIPILKSIETIQNEFVCEDLKLKIDKTDGLAFYGVMGGRRLIAQEYTIGYNTLKWNEERKIFENSEKLDKYTDLGVEKIIAPPLKDTQFRLSGDQFAEYFGITNSIESAMYESVAVEPHIMPHEDQLGLSAPVSIKLNGYSNGSDRDYYTWMICKASDPKNPIARYTDRDVDYQFDASGDFKVYLEAANANSTCIKKDSIFISIGTSYLDVPNYFSPDASPGVNDEFRVAYKSLVQFKCTIFNRNGTKLFQWTDPEKGWDGRSGGRFVNTGVYYYVIEAKGSDGKIYKQGGDINILRAK